MQAMKQQLDQNKQVAEALRRDMETTCTNMPDELRMALSNLGYNVTDNVVALSHAAETSQASGETLRV